MEGLERVSHGQRLGLLLKRSRRRIAPNRTSLGSFQRLSARIGKAVTQEEVAEAAGISRQWYATLELDRPARVSASVLGRLADALLMDDAERELLFRLAVPELRFVSFMDRSSSIVEAFASLRTLVHRLWAADTESEAVAIAREHAMSLLSANVDAVIDRADCVDDGVAVANVRSRRGLVAQLSAKGHELTELEREQLRTVAELTSLAIAGPHSN